MTGTTPEPASGPEPRVPAQPAEPARTDPGAARLTVPIPVPVPARPPRRTAAIPKPHRHPALALPAVILFGLLAAFFAWQSAEPLWLAVGRGVAGTATVTRCQPTDPPIPADAGSTGSTYRCVTFTPPDHAFHAVDVTLLGAGSAGRSEGTTLPARMVTPDADRAYATSPGGLHLRWSVGLVLVLACGAGIAWATGARRLDGRRSRRRAILFSFAGPVLLAVGFFTAAL